MRALVLGLLVASLAAQAEPRISKWTAPGKGDIEIQFTHAVAEPAPFVLIAGGGDEATALARALAVRGITAAMLEEPTVHTLPAADGLLRQSANELGLDATRVAFAAVPGGAHAAMHLAHEERAQGRGLVLFGTFAHVVEGLNADLPLLVIAAPNGEQSLRSGQREVAHQSSLAGAPSVYLETADPVAAAVRFFAARLLPPPELAGEIAPDEAWELARACGDRGDAKSALAWLDRALAAQPQRAGDLAADHGFAGIRRNPAFAEFLRTRAPTGALQLVAAVEAGQPMQVRCRFTNARGEPLAGVIVDAWQTDALGIYDHRAGVEEPRLHGSVRTDADGCFVLHSVRPGGYPATMIPAHVHLRVYGERAREVELLFADDPRLTDVVANRMVAHGYGVVRLDGEGQGSATFALPAGR